MAQEAVLAALAKRVECYRTLAKLAQVQHEHVQDGRTEDLLRVLAQRQELLDSVGELEQWLSPIKKVWGDFLDGLSGEDRTRAESMMQQTLQLLAQITAADRNDVLVLQQRKLNLGKEIKQATAARRLNASYAAAAYGHRQTALDLQQ